MKERIIKLDKKENVFDYIPKHILSVDLGGTDGTRTNKWIENIKEKIISM